jgi:hypothetical protein
MVRDIVARSRYDGASTSGATRVRGNAAGASIATTRAPRSLGGNVHDLATSWSQHEAALAAGTAGVSFLLRAAAHGRDLARERAPEAVVAEARQGDDEQRYEGRQADRRVCGGGSAPSLKGVRQEGLSCQTGIFTRMKSKVC